SCERTFELMKQPVCFVGHTHVPVVFVKKPGRGVSYHDVETIRIEPGTQYIVNVGSVGQPRDSIPKAAYCIYDTESRTVQIKRAPYEVFSARRRIVEAGLPHFLGDRLLTGN
ncbi:MAG: metallophosphoesterase family protein, partial [Candidatus Omnitrophica bacterium]|nr:metallophosphoesterase family protein [Candidatus Omnitrophota bacterium]